MQEYEAGEVVKDWFSIGVNVSMFIGLLLMALASLVFGVNIASFVLVCVALAVKLVEDIVNEVK